MKNVKPQPFDIYVTDAELRLIESLDLPFTVESQQVPGHADWKPHLFTVNREQYTTLYNALRDEGSALGLSMAQTMGRLLREGPQ